MTAAELIGDIVPGCEIFGLTEGHMSLIDIVEHCLAATGPAAMDAMLWTYFHRHIDRIFDLVRSGQITRSRWLVDGFNLWRDDSKSAYIGHLRSVCGHDNVRCTRVHAKIITISNCDWSLVIRSSGNLNKNLRSENYEISDDPSMLQLVTSMMDDAMADPMTDPDLVQGDGGKQIAVQSSQALLGAIEYPVKPPTVARHKQIRYA